MAYKIQLDRDNLIAALLKREWLLDNKSHWIALRIYSDGTVAVAEEISRCVSEDEFNRRMPHTVTCLGASGNGQCNLAEGWEDEFDPDYGERAVVSALENAGYEVEII
jgi:hypothetical protein